MSEVLAQVEELRVRVERLEKMLGTAAPISESYKRLPRGERLAQARNSADLSQAQLAEKAGVSTNTIINFENGHTVPRQRTLMALAEAVGMPWEWLDE